MNDTNWNIIHGPMKSMIRTLITGSSYILKGHVIENPDKFKSPLLKRFCKVWDLAFDAWRKENGQLKYVENDMYKLLVQGRNIALTILDNDEPYLRLAYHLAKKWEETKDD